MNRNQAKCDLPPVCEVFNLFAREIPQQGLASIDKGRTRQTMVPDFKISIPVADDRAEPGLYEIVFSSSFTCMTWNKCLNPEKNVSDNKNLKEKV